MSKSGKIKVTNKTLDMYKKKETEKVRTSQNHKLIVYLLKLKRTVFHECYMVHLNFLNINIMRLLLH